MRIPDPGNAATASQPNGHPPQDDQRADRRSRAMALALALTSALVLLPSVALAGFVHWKWFPVGLGAWFTVMLIASSIVTYRLGPARGRR